MKGSILLWFTPLNPHSLPKPKIFSFFHLPPSQTHFFPKNYFLLVKFTPITFFMKTVRMELMRNPTQIRLYDIFRKDLHMPDDRAQNLVSTINEALNDHSAQDREDLATKE